MTRAGPPERVRLTLTAQVIALVMGTVIAAQAVTILAVYLLPPTAPPVYSLVQVAAALRGESFASDQHRALKRRLLDAAPPELMRSLPYDNEGARLAGLLGVAAEDVRVRRRGPPPFVMLTSGNRPGAPGPGRSLGPGPGLGPDFGPDADMGSPPQPFGGAGPVPRDRFGPRWLGPDSAMLRGEFLAGWRQADGRWAVVEPEPEMEWLQRLALWVVGGALVMGPVGYWFARRISAPLQAFAVSAEALGRDPKAAMMAPSGPAEIGVAARAFNAMQARLQRYVAERVSMVGAISHDLRTPLTRIRFKLEKADPDVRDAVLSDVAQMEHMISAVIAFSRDAAAPSVRERLDLTSLVASVADDAAETGADVEAPLEQSFVIDGDPVALQRLFANLIDNAVKYGRRARISIDERGGEAVVRIADSGPGLPQRELDKVFTPFYRTEAAQHQGSPGVGLGLSIARAVAQAHGGDVVLNSSAGGLTAEVVLPLARA
ncbi:MAG TPA: HAMP domain-containing sensor histidine kinase [Caulobacteraceae bacterium]|nr:HAMP domain-containing sensor histidine kinase [Caulobacteraceae bacterium]